MRRREFIALIGASVTCPFAALAQEPGRIYRVGGVSSSPRNAAHIVAMFDELRRAGFVWAKTSQSIGIVMDLRTDLIPRICGGARQTASRCHGMTGDEAIRAVQQATKTIPIVAIPKTCRIRAGDLAGAAQRQYNRRQYLRDRI